MNPIRLTWSDDQQLIEQTAQQFFAEHGGVAHLRSTRSAPAALSTERWRAMAELGWTGIALDEGVGGLGLGITDLGLILSEAGKHLAPEPLVEGLLLGARGLSLCGSVEQQAEWLPKVATGEAIVALAYTERGGRYNVDHCETTAVLDEAGTGYVLNGAKHAVVLGADADVLIVSAREPNGDAPSLFLVAADAAGLTRAPQTRIDHRPSAIITLDGVKVGPGARLPKPKALQRAVDIATIGLCAELMGGMHAAFEMALVYLKDRQQFGVPIGSFQALQHRAANLYVEIELAKSATMMATRAADIAVIPDKQLQQAASLAKARCSDTYLQVAYEGVQMFGGVGMTDEFDIGLHLKRARAAAQTFGDSAWHRERWATLAGY